MKQIWKWELDPKETQKLEVPVGTIFLSAGEQFDSIMVWGLVDPRIEAVEIRTIEVYGTGHPIDSRLPEVGKFLGRANLSGGRFIFHVFSDY
jgi:hypothetical protein